MSVVIDKILNLGDDQLANQFIVLFPDGLPGGGDVDNLSLRLDEGFDMPSEEVNVYNIKYRGMDIPKTGMAEQTSKEFELIARLDKDWTIWKSLRTAYKYTYNPITGTAMSEADSRFSIEVQALDNNNNIIETVSFKNSKLKTLKGPAFGHEEEGPAKITMSFLYGSMEFS
ncbi:MAG: hypothetical protein GY853_09830 [PVC group bacterium]|nr:hypothetical protein [PVC group bacterium]